MLEIIPTGYFVVEGSDTPTADESKVPLEIGGGVYLSTADERHRIRFEARGFNCELSTATMRLMRRHYSDGFLKAI